MLPPRMYMTGLSLKGNGRGRMNIYYMGENIMERWLEKVKEERKNEQ